MPLGLSLREKCKSFLILGEAEALFARLSAPSIVRIEWLHRVAKEALQAGWVGRSKVSAVIKFNRIRRN